MRDRMVGIPNLFGKPITVPITAGRAERVGAAIADSLTLGFDLGERAMRVRERALRSTGWTDARRKLHGDAAGAHAKNPPHQSRPNDRAALNIASDRL